MAKITFGVDKLFLPPYSPFLNPIELAFNLIKTQIQNEKWTNRGELITQIKEKFSQLTSENAQSFYTHSSKYFDQCKLGLPFICYPLSPEIPNSESNLLIE